MLVLSRRVTECLRIGDDVEVEVLAISGNQVKLGIRAPRQIPVMRTELINTIQQNTLAARTGPHDVILNLPAFPAKSR